MRGGRAPPSPVEAPRSLGAEGRGRGRIRLRAVVGVRPSTQRHAHFQNGA